MRIWIAGAPRTGTTLLQLLMFAFEGVDVVIGERPLRLFVRIGDWEERRLVGKRVRGLFSGPLTPSELDTEVRLMRTVRPVVMVREVEEVTRPIPYIPDDPGKAVARETWDAAMDQLDRWGPDLKPVVVRYQDLLGHPGRVQIQLSQELDLHRLHRFEDFPAFLPDWVKARAAPFDNYRPRPIGAPA